MELSAKDEAIKNLTDSEMKTESVGSSQKSSMGTSMVHDVSVDDRVFEDNVKSISAAVPEVTPAKPVAVFSPIVRGPSASSTPNKSRRGSIADELKEIDFFPSPLCEKRAGEVKKEVIKYVEKLGESVRKIVLENSEGARSGHIMTILNKEIFSVKRQIEDMVDELPSKEELKSAKENAVELESKLAKAECEIQNLKDSKPLDDPKLEVQEEEVEILSSRMNIVTNLLRTANSALLATHEGSVVKTDCSLEAETDLSNWQLDLEGIQLVEYSTQMSKKLIQYTKIGKKNMLTELSANIKSPFPKELSKSPVPTAKMWQSIYKRLEELHKESEVSRDLLMMAEDSMREQSMNQSRNLVFPKTIACQTEPVSFKSQPSQTSSLPKIACVATEKADSVNENVPCPTEDCFCKASESRRGSSQWRGIFKVFGSVVFLLFIFTFFGGLEIDHSVYYPVTWYPLRSVAGDWLPHPTVAMSFKTVVSKVL